jgi:hypothetical protein
VTSQLFLVVRAVIVVVILSSLWLTRTVDFLGVARLSVTCRTASAHEHSHVIATAAMLCYTGLSAIALMLFRAYQGAQCCNGRFTQSEVSCLG